MATTASVPMEQPQTKPSFAKVAASSYKPQNLKENQPNVNSTATGPPPAIPLQHIKRATPSEGDTPKVRISLDSGGDAKEKAGSTAIRTGQWANVTGQQVAFLEEPEKPRPAIMLVKASTGDDNTTQLSSSDGSAKPPSLDGKSVASATTFALDEKESLRPDDSASLRAVEEEDVISPPDSVAAGSRVGSDSGVARAFHEQLHEIAVMGPLPQRGAPPGRFPTLPVNTPHTLYDPSQAPNGLGRPMPQPVAIDLPNMAGSHNLNPVPDEKLIEALASPRDRLFVLKVEQDFIDFIKNSRENEITLPNCNTFYRMLTHRLADYYLLGHIVDNTMTGVKITRTSFCRIPPPLSALPVSSKSTNTPPVDLPARKIMRREDGMKSGTNTTTNSEGPSKTTSESGGGSGSDGGNDSNEAEGKDKSALTREEREARYREARERIFGSAETEEGESTEAAAAGEERDASRSSSASGKKKSKKQRNYDDDFEARSRFNAFYPSQYPVSGYGGDQAVYYGGFPDHPQSPQFPGMGANASPPPVYNGGYSTMMSQDAQAHYGWPGQQYQQSNGPMGYPTYPPSQNGYDLSADFQRGMQSFQSTGLPSQMTPKLANAPIAPYQDPYPSQPMPMSSGWSQMNQSSYSMGQGPYAQNVPSNRPISAPMQGPLPSHYPYGQFPPSTYNGKPNRNQHPLPGSFNRQQFNPQSQTFVPTGRNVPFQMQPSMSPIPNQGTNGFGVFQGPVSNHMSRPSPPVTHSQTFGSPHSMQSSHPVPVRGIVSTPNPMPQVVNSQTVTAPSSSQSNSSSIPAQSSIAKYGTPSHLPPRPPAPAQAQPPKFSLPANFSSGSRASNNVSAGFNASPVSLRGGSGSGSGSGLPNTPS